MKSWHIIQNALKTLRTGLEMYELEREGGAAIADVCSITKPTVFSQSEGGITRRVCKACKHGA